MFGMTDEETQLPGLPLTSQVILESDSSTTHLLFHPIEMKPVSSQRTVRTREVCTCVCTHAYICLRRALDTCCVIRVMTGAYIGNNVHMETVRPQNKGEHHCLRCGVEVSEAHRSEDLKHERCVTW